MHGAGAILLANALVAVVGAGGLPVLGIARSPRELLQRIGLGLVVGLAVCGILGATLAVVHVAFGWTALGSAAIVSSALGANALRARVKPAGRAQLGLLDRIVALVGGGAIVALLVQGGRALAVQPLDKWDGWAMWATKGKDLYLLGWADPKLFAQQPGLPHPDYPLLIPSLEAMSFRALGRFDGQLVHLQLFLFAPALVFGLWSLLGDRIRPVVLCPVLAAIAGAPALLGQLATGYADVPLAAFFALGATAAARWLLWREAWALRLAVLLFGAALLTKSEALLEVAAAFVALALVLWRGREPRRLRPLALAAVATGLLLLPWRVFTTVHHLGNQDYSLSDVFRLGYVGGRIGRGPIALHSLLGALFDVGNWALLVPLFLVASAAAVLLRRRRDVLAFGWTTLVLSLGGLLVVYVISPLGIGDYLAGTTERVVAPLVLAGAALAPLLLGEARFEYPE